MAPTSLPHPTELRYFLAVAECLNISRAAERIGATQPTVSLGIQRLERSVGLPLLTREKRGVKLTPAGKRFLAQARQLLQQWERLRTEAIQDHESPRGSFSLGCHTAVALYTLPEFLTKLLAQHPGIEFRLEHDLSRRITEKVARFEIDLGIVVNPLEHPDLVITELLEDEVAFWKHRSLKEESLLLCHPELGQTQALLKKAKKAGIRFERTLTSESLEVLAELTASGLGVGLLPARVARRGAGRQLNRIGPSNLGVRDRVCLVHRVDFPKSGAFRLITETLKKTLKSNSALS